MKPSPPSFQRLDLLSLPLTADCLPPERYEEQLLDRTEWVRFVIRAAGIEVALHINFTVPAQRMRDARDVLMASRMAIRLEIQMDYRARQSGLAMTNHRHPFVCFRVPSWFNCVALAERPIRRGKQKGPMPRTTQDSFVDLRDEGAASLVSSILIS